MVLIETGQIDLGPNSLAIAFYANQFKSQRAIVVYRI